MEVEETMVRTTKQELQDIRGEIELLRSEVRGLVLEVKYLVDMMRREKPSPQKPNLFNMEVR